MEVTSMPKTLETEIEYKSPLPTKATEIQNPRPLSFTINGVLKRQKYQNHSQKGSPIVISYKECLRNHAATLGGHALDGCGEFMPSPAATPADPTSLKCSACGCHRNFHRREPEGSLSTQIVEFKRHNQPSSPISPHRRSPINSPSPPPLSSSYYPSAPHMLLALSTGLPGAVDNQSPVNPDGRKRYRTKFSQEQKEKMFSFSEKLGWKMQKSDEGMVDEFCNEVGVGKGVLKVWMHNNKHTLGKKDVNSNNIITDSLNNPNNQNNNSSGHHLATNGSSSSS